MSTGRPPPGAIVEYHHYYFYFKPNGNSCYLLNERSLPKEQAATAPTPDKVKEVAFVNRSSFEEFNVGSGPVSIFLSSVIRSSKGDNPELLADKKEWPAALQQDLFRSRTALHIAASSRASKVMTKILEHYPNAQRDALAWSEPLQQECPVVHVAQGRTERVQFPIGTSLREAVNFLALGKPSTIQSNLMGNGQRIVFPSPIHNLDYRMGSGQAFTFNFDPNSASFQSVRSQTSSETSRPRNFVQQAPPQTRQAEWVCRGHAMLRHDMFLSYRQGLYNDNVRELRDALELQRHPTGQRNLRVFWDQVCLPLGEDWLRGFLGVLQNSDAVVLLISNSVAERVKASAHTSQDNVLLEWDAALAIRRRGQCRVVPVWVGEGDVPYDMRKHAAETFPDALPFRRPETPAVSDQPRTIRTIIAELYSLHGSFLRAADLARDLPAKLQPTVTDMIYQTQRSSSARS